MCHHKVVQRLGLCVSGVEQWPLLPGRGASQTESRWFRRADVPHSSNSHIQGHRRDSLSVDEGWPSRGCNPTRHCAPASQFASDSSLNVATFRLHETDYFFLSFYFFVGIKCSFKQSTYWQISELQNAPTKKMDDTANSWNNSYINLQSGRKVGKTDANTEQYMKLEVTCSFLLSLSSASFSVFILKSRRPCWHEIMWLQVMRADPSTNSSLFNFLDLFHTLFSNKTQRRSQRLFKSVAGNFVYTCIILAAAVVYLGWIGWYNSFKQKEMSDIWLWVYPWCVQVSAE